MSNIIVEKVKQIREAIYGKDVREAIASSIEAINDESETAVAASTNAASSAETSAKNAATALNLCTTASNEAKTATTNANAATENANAAATEANNARKNIWIKYATSIDGANMHSEPASTDYYIGVAITTNSVEPLVATAYTWSLFRGADGQGVGDMLKATYDSDNRGYVDRALLADSLSNNQLEVIEEQIANAGGCVVSASAPTNTNALWIDISGTNAMPKYYDSTSSTWKTMSAVWG